ACMSNLLIFCDRRDQADEVAMQVPQIVVAHPARVLLLVGEEDADNLNEPSAGSARQAPQAGGILASVLVRRLAQARDHRCFSEQVTLRAAGVAVAKLPFAVRGLLIGDLPINLWWRSQQPPPLAGPLLYELAENAQQIIYDSFGWLDPARAVAAASSWLA